MSLRFERPARPAMRYVLLAVLLGACTAGPSSAIEDRPGGNLHIQHVFAIGRPEANPVHAEVTEYSNIGQFSGYFHLNGGAGLEGGNGITRVVADDLTGAGLAAGQDVVQFAFTVANTSSNFVTCRARVRFWFENGSGVPAAFYNVPMLIGLTFNPLDFPPGVVLVTADLAPGLFTMPTGTFWAGITFDNDNGTTGATLDDLNHMGQGLFSPPEVGTSTDIAFLTEQPGSYFGVAFPQGSRFDFGGAPPANFGWTFTAVEATPVARSTWGRIKHLYR